MVVGIETSLHEAVQLSPSLVRYILSIRDTKQT
jgi:hypothetical protein